ncbi:MAG: chromosome segregation protein SMC [Armatimonadota bacterium]
MQLRRLELIGFKTFVDRTELEFHPGITAIVGPNGTGKSNIFDGVRWALGETNARLLRGARMDDVIFSGSATRRAQSLATVALTFDNSAGLLPLEFNEVTVTRRVTRGGEGEYGINGVDCRLRDVQMLFLGTGLGGRSYALIGQGEVDAVLRATPIERRHWLEEAAGLARHKRQRTEAERRLDHAQVHLNRLTDLLDELEHQQQALAVQAEAATLQRSYSQELRELELALFADEARRLLGTVRRLGAQLDADREQAAAAERRVVEAAADVAMVEAHLGAATAAWERGQETLLEGAEAISAKAAEVQALQARAERLSSQAGHLNAEVGRLREERAVLAADAETLGNEAADAARRREAQARELDDAESGLARAAAAAEEGEARLAQREQEAAEVGRTLAQSHNDLAALGAKAEILAQSVVATEQKAGALGQVAAHLIRDREAAQQASAHARQAVQSADERLAGASTTLEGCRQELNAAAEAVHAAELDEHRLRTRLSAMEEAAAQFTGFEEGVRQVLLAAKSDPQRFPGLRGAIVDHLSVPEAYRQALGAALGRRLYCLVVDDRAALHAVVRFLTTEASGRATVLARNALRPRHPAASATDFGVQMVVRAADVVDTDTPIRPVVEALLGDVAITDDLTGAWRLFAAGYPGRIVTREGTLLSPDGVVSVGGGVSHDATPLGRTQVIADLRAALARAEAQSRESERRRSDAILHGADAEEALHAARGDRDTAAALLAARLQRLAGLQAEATRVAGEEAAQAGEAQSVAVHLQRLQAEITGRHADVRRLDEEARRLDADVMAAQEDVERHEAAREAAAAAVTTYRLALVQLDASLEAFRVRLGDRNAAMADLDARSTDLAGQIEGVSADLAGVSLERDKTAAAYDRLGAGQAATKADVERVSTERIRLRDELAQQQGVHVAAVEAARAAEVAMHRTELRSTQADAELGAAATRLREQYGITLEESATRRLEGTRDDARRRLDELRAALRELGPVNLRAIDEHAAVTARLDALRAQTDDLRSSGDALRQAIAHINAALRVRFRETFDEVNREFGRLFERLFEGGQGELELVEDVLGAEPGLEVIAQLPGKKRRPLVALSGGERALVALTLIFAMLRVHPSPFCIFDEVEAALDDANTKRFTELLKDLALKTQVLIITHNKGTMTAADILYGVTMQEPGLSSIVSVRLVAPERDEGSEAREAPRVRQESRAPHAVALPAE